MCLCMFAAAMNLTFSWILDLTAAVVNTGDTHLLVPTIYYVAMLKLLLYHFESYDTINLGKVIC